MYTLVSIVAIKENNLYIIYILMFFLDIDECMIDTLNNCNEVDSNSNCMNTEGSYTCVCKSGYTRDGHISCTSMKAFVFCYMYILF